jgi:hypothetical protein
MRLKMPMVFLAMVALAPAARTAVFGFPLIHPQLKFDVPDGFEMTRLPSDALKYSIHHIGGRDQDAIFVSVYPPIKFNDGSLTVPVPVDSSSIAATVGQRVLKWHHGQSGGKGHEYRLEASLPLSDLNVSSPDGKPLYLVLEIAATDEAKAKSLLAVCRGLNLPAE